MKLGTSTAVQITHRRSSTENRSPDPGSTFFAHSRGKTALPIKCVRVDRRGRPAGEELADAPEDGDEGERLAPSRSPRHVQRETGGAHLPPDVVSSFSV